MQSWLGQKKTEQKLVDYPDIQQGDPKNERTRERLDKLYTFLADWKALGKSRQD